MNSIGIVVEGLIDRVAVERILQTRSLTVDTSRVVITRGKSTFDARISKYNEAARHGPWLALRDADHDSDGCAAALHSSLLTATQSRAFCLRIAVRTLESWLLGDAEAFARHFTVPVTKIPRRPDELDWPKKTLVNVCSSSRRKDVRMAMVPPANTTGVGPEYTAFLSHYCRESWRPDVAGDASPSLRRALLEIDQLITDGIW